MILNSSKKKNNKKHHNYDHDFRNEKEKTFPGNLKAAFLYISNSTLLPNQISGLELYKR